MNKRRRISDYHEEILKLAKDNTLLEISRKLNLPRSSLSGYFERHNMKPFTKRSNLEDFTEQIVKLASDGKNSRQIAIELGVDSASLRYHAIKLGINIVDGRFNKDDPELEKQAINLHNKGNTYDEIAEELNISPKRVPRILDKHGVPKRTTEESFRKRNPINDDAFLDFDTEEAVYWYGWLLTDGSISDNNNISIGLKGTDAPLLHRMAKYLGPSIRVRECSYFHKQSNKYVSSASLSLKSDLIGNRLLEQGMFPRKSCKENLPKFDWLDGEHASIFWRAVLEGDGYISNYENRHPELSLVGSEELLRGFKTFVMKHCDVSNNREIKSKAFGDPNFKILNYTGIDALKIMKVLWSKGSLFLERKRERVKGNLEKYAYRFDKQT